MPSTPVEPVASDAVQGFATKWTSGRRQTQWLWMSFDSEAGARRRRRDPAHERRSSCQRVAVIKNRQRPAHTQAMPVPGTAGRRSLLAQ